MTNSKPKSKSAPNSTGRLSMSAENYLLSIYRLDEQDARVTLTVLSEHLKTLPVDEGMGTSLPSVGGMIRRMVREGLLENTPQKDVVLTNSGRKSAESIVRRMHYTAPEVGPIAAGTPPRIRSTMRLAIRG